MEGFINWIKVSDRLPDDDGKYIVWLKSHKCPGGIFPEGAHFVYYDKASGEWWDEVYDPMDECETRLVYYDRVIAWMPIPSYKED